MQRKLDVLNERQILMDKKRNQRNLRKLSRRENPPHRTLVLRRSPSGFASGASHLSAACFSSKELN